MFMFIIEYTGCLNNKYLSGFLGKAGSYFPKTFLNYKLPPISTSIKKSNILTHIEIKLQARQFSQYCLSEKASHIYLEAVIA